MNGPINDWDMHTLSPRAERALCLHPRGARLHVEAVECPSAALARPSSALLRPCAAVTGSHCSNKCVHIAALASSPLLAESLLSCPPPAPPHEEKDFDCARGERLGGQMGKRDEEVGVDFIYIRLFRRHSSDFKRPQSN